MLIPCCDCAATTLLHSISCRAAAPESADKSMAEQTRKGAVPRKKHADDASAACRVFTLFQILQCAEAYWYGFHRIISSCAALATQVPCKSLYQRSCHCWKHGEGHGSASAHELLLSCQFAYFPSPKFQLNRRSLSYRQSGPCWISGQGHG